MTDQQHPITPPDELVEQWASESLSTQRLCTKAARWGYEQRGAVNEAELQKARDEELDACCEYIAGPGEWFPNSQFRQFRLDELRAARRPETKSLKLRIAEAIAKGNKQDALSLLDEALDD